MKDVDPDGGKFTIAKAIQAGSPTFTATEYLAHASARQVGAVLAACPLSEIVYALTLPAESQLEYAPALSLLVTPQESRFLVAALLTVQPDGGEETMLTSWGIGVLDAVPLVPRRLEFRLSPVAEILPANTILRLRLRNHWLREAPQARTLEVDALIDAMHQLEFLRGGHRDQDLRRGDAARQLGQQQ